MNTGNPLLALIPILVFALSGSAVIRSLKLKQAKGFELLPLAWLGMAGLFSLVILILGLCGKLSPVALWSACAMFALPNLLWLRRDTDGVRSDPLGWKDYCPLIVSLLPLLLILPMTLMMPIGDDWDGLSYHLAIPLEYLRVGAIRYVPYDHHSNFPFTVEMWYLWSLGSGAGAIGAKLFHWFCSLLTVYTLWVAARRLKISPTAQAVSGLLLGSIPLFGWEASVAYLDNAFCLAICWFGICGILALQSQSRERVRWTVFSGIVAGICLGIKMTAVSILPITAIAVMMCFPTILWKERLKWLGSAVGLALAIGGCWYLKTMLYTGNPFYPYFYGIFGGHDWSTQNAELYRQAQQAFGFGRTALDFVLTPLRLVTDYDRFFDPMPLVGSSGFMGLLLLLGLVFWKRWNAAGRALWLFIGLNWVAWFFQMQQIRYLVFLFPVIILVAVKALDDQRGIARWITPVVVLVQLVVFVGMMVPRLSASLLVLTGQSSVDSYLKQYGRGLYSTSDWLNANTPIKDRVAVFDETRVFYLNRRLIWANPGHHTLIPYDQMKQPAELCQWLVEHGYRWVWQNERLVVEESHTEPWRLLLEQAKKEGLLEEQARFGKNAVYRVISRPQ